MGITDELRAWAKEHLSRSSILAIADRIDAEHEKACDDAWNNGYEADYLGIEKWLTEHPQAMEHHGWVCLPKNADGEYIRAGDKLDGYGKTITVVEMRIGRSGWVLISRDGNAYADTFAFTHHAPTVEEVLREFGDWYAHTKGGCDEDGIVAEYAKRLTLRTEVDA